MPIEFRCAQCQRLLRVPDETAGKQAQCPQCQALMTIPAPDGALPFPQQPKPQNLPERFASLEAEPIDSQSRAAKTAGAGSAPDDGVAYQFTSYTPRARQTSDPGGRTGPPWERDQASLRSFVATILEAYANPARFYANMRRRGGIGAPLMFAMISATLAFVFALGFQLVFRTWFEALGMYVPGGGDIGPLQTFCCCCSSWPCFLVLYLFLSAGLYHLLLTLLGGMEISFETTFRVVAYSTGTSYILMLIPGCGQFVFPIVQMVFCIVGLAHAHETSVRKAAGAVLIPVAIFCSTGVALLYAFWGMLMQAMQR